MSKRQLSLFQAFEKKRSKPTITNTQQSSDNEGATSSQAGREDEVASYASSSSASLAVAAAVSEGPSPEPAENTRQQQRVVSAAAYEDDLGCVKADELKTTSDSVKLKAIQSRFKPPRGWVPPARVICGKQRKIPEEFFDESIYPTLRYSKSVDGVFCVACMLFSSDDMVLRTKPLTDWSNAKKIVSRHMSTPAHHSAQLRAGEFVDVALGKSQSIYSKLDRSHELAVERNKHGLKAVIDLIAVCGQQNLPIRGHTDERSNFQVLLNYRAKGDEKLREYLENAPSNAKYCSHSVQNELIELCGKQIQDTVLKKCRDAEWFSLLADETADISNVEQVALVLRYVDCVNSSYSLREDFLGFFSTADTTGETLTQLLLGRLRELDLDPARIVGQGYDGAGNVSGKVRGVQARIREQYPAAVYVHCRNHALNLAIVHSTKIPVVRNTLNTAQELVSFITASPKRLQCLLRNSSSKKRLQKFSDTRWSQHDMCLSTVIDNYEDVVTTLAELKTDADAKCSSAASALSRAMETFEFIICLTVTQELLHCLTPLSNGLQNPKCELPMAARMATDLVTVLEKKRDDSTYDNIWGKACSLAELVEVIPSLPRIAKKQAHRSNTPAANPQEYWKRTIFLPFIDHLTTEVRDRVCLALPRLKAQYLLPDKLPLLTDSLWMEIKEEYGALMPSVDTADVELNLWRQHNRAKDDTPVTSECDILQVLRLTADFYPNVHTVIKVLLTMPVSTASAERSFSCLRRLKTYLRNTMTDKRLSGLALMNIHHDIPIDSEAILREFDVTGRRRINIK
ncbi:repressor of the inhibitor of the protein kinase [Merluccius polli]|uniref:Repressor of the inhibitor of the protein kinase n=1 Tax=Merluccius polli TaxID=89951 RepID=A0AA47P1F0_MERPO|nr:repressor of the inhibitor of the protein kinase [Merluccius polli]